MSEIYNQLKEKVEERKNNHRDTITYFEKIDKPTVLHLVKKIGSGIYDDPLEDCQNYSPTMREFLEESDNYPNKVSYSGYVIWKPRDDYRVTVTTINFHGLDRVEFREVVEKYYKSSDDDWLDWNNGNAWFWWD